MNKRALEIIITIDDELKEIGLIVRSKKPISELTFVNAIYNFCENSDDLDFSNVISDLKEMDLELN